MKNKNFLLRVDLAGEVIYLKSRKCQYAVDTKMYKVSMPSSLSESPICWIAQDGENWNTVLGKPNTQLNSSLISAIYNLEQAKPEVAEPVTTEAVSHATLSVAYLRPIATLFNAVINKITRHPVSTMPQYIVAKA